MTLIRKLNPRSLGGLAGIVVAVAGGLGAAVGLYSLPLPQGASGGLEAYARVTQRAFTAATLEADESFETLLRIQATRGGFAHTAAGVDASDFPRASGFQDVNVRFHAEVCSRSVGEENCGPDQTWDESVPATAFEFDPLMNAAEFHGDVQGCHFDVVWHPDGPIVPFEGHHESTNSAISPGPPGANAFVTGFAELSRIAPAEIQMGGESCFSYSRPQAPGDPQAPGYLTQGAEIPTLNGGVNTQGPVDP